MIKQQEFQMPKVSLAQHRQMARLGISFRPSDGQWGFKLRCHRKGCEELVQNCYCAPTLEAAVERVKGRANWYHDWRCIFLEGYADEYTDWKEVFQGQSEVVSTLQRANIDLSDPHWGKKAASDDAVWKALGPVVVDEASNWDCDPDEEACACEI